MCPAELNAAADILRQAAQTIRVRGVYYRFHVTRSEANGTS